MNNGPQTDWYSNLNKAPWTPPGWVFGFAWTTIMLCFSIYLIALFQKVTVLKTVLYIEQVIPSYIQKYLFDIQNCFVYRTGTSECRMELRLF